MGSGWRGRRAPEGFALQVSGPDRRTFRVHEKYPPRRRVNGAEQNVSEHRTLRLEIPLGQFGAVLPACGLEKQRSRSSS